MMKRIIYIMLLVLLTSCKGWLTEQPAATLTETGVFGNEASLESQIRGILRGFEGDAMYQGNMNEHLHSASGLIHWGATTRLKDERWTSLLRLTESSMSLNVNMFAGHYTAIDRCNKLLAGLPGSPVDGAYKAEIEAEARFYRAVLYYTLVRCYGDVPLRLTPTRSAEDLAVPRTPYYQVYTAIVRDLEAAFAGMRDADRVREVTGTQGRPDKWAAKAYLAAVYLSIGSLLEVPADDNFYDASREGRRPDFSALDIHTAADAWQLALDTADDVIVHGPYSLAPKYEDLFAWGENYTLPERIFVLQSTGGNSQNYCSMRSLPQFPEGTQVVSSASRFGNWRPTRLLFQTWCEMYPGEKGGGENNAGLWVTSSDPRLDAALIHTGYKRCNDGAQVNVYPADATIKVSSVTGCYPFFRKYWFASYDGRPGIADFYMMRMAELYYIAAEAAARLDWTDGKAYVYLEPVHARARNSREGAVQPSWTAGQFSSREALLDAIVWDKLFELCGEGHEFFETHRLGASWLSREIAGRANAMLADPLNAALVKGYYNEDGSFRYPTGAELRRSLLCKFPADELSYNPALGPDDQNDFYWDE